MDYKKIEQATWEAIYGYGVSPYIMESVVSAIVAALKEYDRQRQSTIIYDSSADFMIEEEQLESLRRDAAEKMKKAIDAWN